jgi:hypothetical protein
MNHALPTASKASQIERVGIKVPANDRLQPQSESLHDSGGISQVPRRRRTPNLSHPPSPSRPSNRICLPFCFSQRDDVLGPHHPEASTGPSSNSELGVSRTPAARRHSGAVRATFGGRTKCAYLLSISSLGR